MTCRKKVVCNQGGNLHEGKTEQTTLPAATVIVRDFKCTPQADFHSPHSRNLHSSRITESAFSFQHNITTSGSPHRPAQTILITTYNDATDSRFDSQPFAFASSSSSVAPCKISAYVWNLTFARYA